MAGALEAIPQGWRQLVPIWREGGLGEVLEDGLGAALGEGGIRC